MIYYIKTLHTIIWAILAAMILYLLYAGITGIITGWVWICLAIVLVECFVIVLNKGICPLTPFAARYTADRRHNFDIYLPEWLARYNKTIFSILFMLALILIIIRVAK